VDFFGILLRMKAKQRTRVVIVGAGFAGIEVAKRLQKSGAPVDLTVVSKSESFEYYPALYRLVTGALPIEVSVPLRVILPQKDISLITGTYTGLDQARQVITLEGGSEIPYDYLVLALGSETNYFNIPGLPENSFSFKSVKEALRLKQHFCTLVAKCKTLPKEEAVALMNTIIVGGGPSGVELAGDLKHYLTRVAIEFGVDPSLVTIDIIEASNRVLPTLPEKASRIAEARLRKMGVNIFTNRALQSQEIEEIALKDMDMKTGTVIWTAGTRINQHYASIPNASFDERKRIVVTPTLTLPNDNHVFIAGDGAGTPYSGLAQTAIHNGAYIAAAIKRLISGKLVRAYVPKRPSFVIPIGNNWALFVHTSMILTGFIPWILRNAVDFRYFTNIVPFSHVLAVFHKGKKYRKVKGGCPVVSEA
jgi:NADH:ubiquinone reductase (H+-translocating)